MIGHGARIPKIIVHDVLQTSRITAVQEAVIKENGTLEHMFRENMKPFEGYPAILAVVAEGLHKTELVDYIKQHPEWTVQCHGLYHDNYRYKPYEVCKHEFKLAKWAIEQIFHSKVTEYYPPFHKYAPWTKVAAEAVGMTEIRKLVRPVLYQKRRKHGIVGDQVDMHYWVDADVRRANAFLEIALLSKPLFIIGAPRSGTTALLNLMAKQQPYASPFKEVEKIWHKETNFPQFYMKYLRRDGKSRIIDKNARNSMRILHIQKMFPDAEFLHIIRDGRAVASSWRLHARRTNKADQSIETAALQWVDYVQYVLKNKQHLTNYSEVRYEDLCESEPEFVSRNEKWKSNLSEADLRVVYDIAGPLLQTLKYM